MNSVEHKKYLEAEYSLMLLQSHEANPAFTTPL